MKASTPDKNHYSYHFIINRNVYYFIVGINTLIIYSCYHDYTYIIVIIVCVRVTWSSRLEVTALGKRDIDQSPRKRLGVVSLRPAWASNNLPFWCTL